MEVSCLVFWKLDLEIHLDIASQYLDPALSTEEDEANNWDITWLSKSLSP